MLYYENILILDPNLDDKAIEDAVERVKNLIIKNGGEILKSENWGRKRLAFTLKKQKKGAYILLLLKLSPTAIIELEKFYKLFDPLVKFLIIKLKKKEVEAVLKSLAEAENKKSESDADTAAAAIPAPAASTDTASLKEN